MIFVAYLILLGLFPVHERLVCPFLSQLLSEVLESGLLLLFRQGGNLICGFREVGVFTEPRLVAGIAKRWM